MTEDERRKAVLFNDIGKAPSKRHVFFSDRRAIADYLWEQGWRRDVRPDDVNSPPLRTPEENRIIVAMVDEFLGELHERRAQLPDGI